MIICQTMSYIVSHKIAIEFFFIPRLLVVVCLKTVYLFLPSNSLHFFKLGVMS